MGPAVVVVVLKREKVGGVQSSSNKYGAKCWLDFGAPPDQGSSEIYPPSGAFFLNSTKFWNQLSYLFGAQRAKNI